ncbi:hypothetical protein L3X38_026924 [Prunus dulcis]|uniref:Uncharacterized protein n=1 Tax=Prunus dulcis TaxID=3755 RepID=A0AAD4VM32_PRUDU|nr:hypothetical protein L3X38_026924 [Prunus dulcis]
MPLASFNFSDPPLFLIYCIQLSLPPSIPLISPHTPFKSLLYGLGIVHSYQTFLLLIDMASPCGCFGFSRTTLKMCRVRAFALFRVPAPPPYTMLICVCSGALSGLIWEMWQLFPSTCPLDVVSCGVGGGSVEFWLGFASFLGLGFCLLA